ncbi:Uncharacterised protein [BD1-7 clade bacterium]|uniref:HopJ type III effector protein n=1 Tax=BD1-7 clade bacterium TaxID=2029982 RepID=A0A5S9QCE1_9GAMM|nr:Uncharacterised protein [BD1-7 clade bacterium]
MSLLDTLNNQPETVQFADVIAHIESNYNYTPTRFTNADAVNDAGTNEGSCKIFAFAQLNNLPEAQTLMLFGDFYRNDVLENPEGTDHANIRNFIQHGWAGINFDGTALSAK